MVRKYEDSFYLIQFTGDKPVQIGDLQMNAEAVKKDLERHRLESVEYAARVRDMRSVKEVLTKEFHQQGLNGKMALESFFAQEIAAFNKKTREDTPEGVEPNILSLIIPIPDPPLAIEFLTFPVGKKRTITDVVEYVHEAQFKGARVTHIGLLNMKQVEAYAEDPNIFIFTALDSVGLNMGEVEKILVDPSKTEDGDNEIDPCSDCGAQDWDMNEETSLWTCNGCGAVFEEPAEDNPPGEEDPEPVVGLSSAEIARALTAKKEDAAAAK